MSHPLNVLVLTPNSTDATSLYRGMGPLGRLRKTMPVLSLSFTDKVNWATLGLMDLVFMQRPYTSDHALIAEMARANGLPVWVDYDDDLFRVPAFNPTYEQYSDERTMKNTAKCIQLANVVSVTTEHLRQNLLPLNKDIRVIPNALDLKRFAFRVPKERTTQIFWRGSATHDKDMMLYTPAMCEAQRANPKFTWTFMGRPFWWTLEQLPEETTVRAPAIDPIEYMHVLHEVAPALMQVPLADCDFNRSKSNIAWLEGTFAGAITLGPDFDEWRKPGCITYKNHTQYLEGLKAVMRGDVDIAHENALAWEYVLDKLTLEKVNVERARIVQQLAECR